MTPVVRAVALTHAGTDAGSRLVGIVSAGLTMNVNTPTGTSSFPDCAAGIAFSDDVRERTFSGRGRRLARSSDDAAGGDGA
jgi:hypothetical protein